MLFLKVTEYVVLALIAILVLTQIVYPAFKGRQLFPLFRKQRKLEVQLAEAVQETHDEQLRRAIEEVRHSSDDAVETVAPTMSTEANAPIQILKRRRASRKRKP